MHQEDWLQISGIERFAFCRRQGALVHLENQWAENTYTVEGNILHQRTHDNAASELRGSLLTVRALRVFSDELGVSGICDVVEFQKDDGGVALQGRRGLWAATPVEYKRGSPKEDDPAALQLCCQAMCLEEMLCCVIPQGYIYYGETRRRSAVAFSDAMRSAVRETLLEMHGYARRGHTPTVRPTKACNACAMREICLPKLARGRSAERYLLAHLEAETS